MAYPSTQKGRISYWQRQIDYAHKCQKPAFDSAQVLIKQYENKPSTDREQYQEESTYLESHIARTKANLIFGWVDQSIANLLERHPHFQAIPQTPDSAAGGPPVSAISNYWYRETDQLHQDERVLLDSFLCPYGVKKLGWTTDLESRLHDLIDQPELDFDDDVTAENMFLLAGSASRVSPGQDHELHLQAHNAALQQPSLSPETQELIEHHISLHSRMFDRMQPDSHTGIQWEAPFGQRWTPSDFLIDPYAQDGLKDARWIDFRWRKPVEDVKSNPNYENLEGLESSDRAEGAPDFSHADDLKEDDFGMVIGHEIWARDFPTPEGRRNMLIVFAEGHDKLLRHETEWPYTNIEDYPAEMLVLQTSVLTWYSNPTLVMAGADSIQALTNEILDSFLYVSRKQKNLLLYDPSVIKKEEADAMLQLPDMSAIPVPGLTEAKGRPVQAIEFGNLSSARGELMSLITNLFDRAAGTPQPVSAPTQETATEASIHERRTTSRETRRGQLLAEYQVRCARKFWQLTTQFRPERSFLIHPQANEWVQVDEEMARGEYRFRIDISSASTARALERKQWMDLLNLFAGIGPYFQQLYGSPPNLARIAEYLLTRGYEIQTPEDILPMITNTQAEHPLDPTQQGQIQQMLEGTAGQVPQEGPRAGQPPIETESNNRVGPALPGLSNNGLPSNSNIEGEAQEAV